MLACWRMGAVRAALQPQLRASDLELRVAASPIRLSASARRSCSAELPDGVAVHDHGEMEPSSTRTAHRRRRPTDRGPRPERPGADRLHLGHDGRAARGPPHRSATCRPARPGRALARRAARASWPGARPRPAGRSRPATSSSRPGWRRRGDHLDARFEPGRALELIERERVTVLCQAPTEYRMLAKRAELRPECRRCGALVSAGEPLNPEVIAPCRERDGARRSATATGRPRPGH